MILKCGDVQKSINNCIKYIDFLDKKITDNGDTITITSNDADKISNMLMDYKDILRAIAEKMEYEI